MSRIRLSGALTAVGALAALVAIGPPGDARAATGAGYDQITGAGQTDSAITVPWTQGLLDDTNQPIAAANAIRSNPTGPLAFMYQDPDFQHLKVIVSQTQDITHQGITVTWSGAQPTKTVGGVPATNYLQLMECYGDASSGPSPQDCEFGSSELGSVPNSAVDTRSGLLCAVDATGTTLPASTTSPPNALDGSSPILGCDPEEPLPGASPADVDPANPQSYTIPFVPVNNASNPIYTQADLNQYFSKASTNEVPTAFTSSDGTGEVQFPAMTSTQAPGLGCGDPESNGQTRNCWLVVVPRGSSEPNGFLTNENTTTTQFLYSSPLSASNWAMRIQVRLNYAPVPAFCPINTQETETVGTQIAARAVQSWQIALNKAANCARIYGYSAVQDATSTQQLADSSSGVGLAFTTIPIGSEAAREGSPPTTINSPILYAPVAVTAVGFGFNINEGGAGFISTPINLTPDLLAKSLTQAYLNDLPDYAPAAGSQFQGPAWSIGNPFNISWDSQFEQLNPEVPKESGAGAAPLLTEDHSALNQQIWQWIQADPGASTWLNTGTGDVAKTARADPDYTALQLGTAPAIDSFPRAYSGCLDLGLSPADSPPVKEELKCSLDQLPYVNNYNEAAANAASGIDPTAGLWDTQAVAPDGSSGWWDKAPPETPGSTFIWGISDTADLAVWGLIDAQLCDDAGNNCVGPSTASLTAAVDAAQPDSAGLREVNPANPGAGGYPLTEVVYAAVPTEQPAASLSAYADLIAYAAGAGQTAGTVPGDLPPGYLPLPASLQAQATTVVDQLRADASASTSPSPGASSGATSGTGATGSAGGTGSSGGAANISGLPVSTASPGTGLSIRPPAAELAATRTQRQPVGAVRWALLVVTIAGAACAVSGTVLRSDGVARWLRQMRQ